MSRSVFLAAEGRAELTLLRRLCSRLSLMVVNEIDAKGKSNLDPALPRYHRAAVQARTNWIVLRDLDHDAPCPGRYIDELGLAVEPRFQLRLAVRTLESWALADFDRFRSVCGFGRRNPPVPANRDDLDDPKGTLTQLVRDHGSRAAKRQLLRSSSGVSPGPGYTSFLETFLASEWRPDVARRHSRSFDRTLSRLEAVTADWA